MAKRSKAQPPPLPAGTPAHMPKGVTEKQVIAALRKWGGIKALAANEVGIARQTMQERVERSAKLQAVIKEVEEETLDLGEGHIIKGVRAGDPDHVWPYMRSKGRKRGYGNTVQTSLDESQLEAIVIALGGSPDALRSALLRLGVDPDQA